MPVSPKVYGGAGGVGLGGAVADLFTQSLSHWMTVSPSMSNDITIIVCAMGAIILGWLTPHDVVAPPVPPAPPGP